jgi:hypothetical protein
MAGTEKAPSKQPPKQPKLPFPLRDGERVVTQSPGAVIHKLGVTTGRLWLTSERVAFQPVVPLAFWIVPLFGLVLHVMNRPHRRELELSKIAAHERTTFGRNRNVLLLVTGDLSRDLKVVIDDYDAFAAALAAQPALSITSPASSPAGSPDAGSGPSNPPTP